MPAIISVLLLLSGLIGLFIGQRMVNNRYDFFFRQSQPENIVVSQIVFVCGNDGSYHKKIISNVLTFGNDWKAFETNDGCRYVLGECFVKEDGQRASISKETKGKWISREDLDQYEKTFGKPIKQLENNTEIEDEGK
jgi:hypothetical protein